MRHLTVHPEGTETLRVKAERLQDLSAYLTEEVEDALSVRHPQEQNWTEGLRQYEGQPKTPIRNVPIENAPNIEVTLGAIAADAIYAQAIDLIFNQVSPLAMVQATAAHDEGDDLVDVAKDMQQWVNTAARNEWNLRPAVEQMALDWDQMGTGVATIVWFDETRKTNVYTVREVGARVFPHPVEDLVVPGGARDDVQTMPWMGLRYWLTTAELAERAKRKDWQVEGFAPIGGSLGWVRSRREQLGRTMTQTHTAQLFEVFDVPCLYDIDGDGLAEDLLVTWDRTSRSIGAVRYFPYDHRNVEVARYQKRAHLFYGMGVLEMMGPYQTGLTEDVCQALTNGRLANTRAWKARPGVVPGGVARIFEGKVFETSDPEGLMELRLSDVYPSNYRNQSTLVAFAEHRVGVRELSGPSPSRIIGGRTPGITALSVIQQTQQRFAPAFDDLRRAVTGAIRQCCWRYRERLLAGDERAAKNVTDVLGQTRGERVIDLLRSDRFEESVGVELTATSASVNRAQDRQDAILLLNLMGQYYTRAIELVSLASNAQAPEPVKMTARQIFDKVSEILDRTIRTFDQVRDPRTFILDMNDALDAIPAAPQGLAGLAQLIGNVLPQGGGPTPGPTGPPTVQ